MRLASSFLLRSKRVHILKFPILTRRNNHANVTLHQVCCACIVSLMIHLIREHQAQPAADFKPYIQTLDPSKLLSKPQKIYDISLRKTLCVLFRTLGGGSSWALLRFQATKEGYDVTHDVPFPAQTRGVFYYHVDPQLPPTGGAIRFRICDSLEAFDKGEDLHITVGKPWDISLPRIARLVRLKELARFLIEEGLVDKNLVEDLRKLKQLGLPCRFVGLFLYHLSQPFVLDLESTALTIHLVTKKTYSFTLFHSPFYSSNKFHRPYYGVSGIAALWASHLTIILGTVKVRFELSTLWEHRKKGPMLVLRILECLSPVQRVSPVFSGPHIEPDPINSLVMRRTSGGTIKPWTYSLDRRIDGSKWKEFIAASKD